MLFELEIGEGEHVFANGIDIRRAFLKMLKSIFGLTDVYEELFGSKKPKPYVTNIAFKRFYPRKESITIRFPITFSFSTGFPEYSRPFASGAAKFANSGYLVELGGKHFQVDDIRAIPHSVTYAENARVSAASHICVPRAGFDRRDHAKGPQYVVPGEDGFHASLNSVVERRMNECGIRKSSPLSLRPIKVEKRAVKFYGGIVFAFKGSFELFGDPTTLNFVRMNGLGAKTGSGFGMIE